MEYQVGFFKEALERLVRPTYFNSQAPKFSSTEKLSESLSKSIFLVNLGTSDYIFNYLQPKDYNTSRQYNGEDFAELLVGKLGNYLTVRNEKKFSNIIFFSCDLWIARVLFHALLNSKMYSNIFYSFLTLIL